MRIIVTKEDIENGQPEDGYNCPIRLALNRQCEPSPYVFVGYGTIANGDKILKVEDIYEFTKTFDRIMYDDDMRSNIEEYVKPFEFDIPVDCDWFK